jgi:hypothetical protein
VRLRLSSLRWPMINNKKTTPQNVREAHEGLFRATMNLPEAAAHCGMTNKELKMSFYEFLKYNAPDFQPSDYEI